MHGRDVGDDSEGEDKEEGSSGEGGLGAAGGALRAALRAANVLAQLFGEEGGHASSAELRQWLAAVLLGGAA